MVLWTVNILYSHLFFIENEDFQGHEEDNDYLSTHRIKEIIYFYLK